MDNTTCENFPKSFPAQQQNTQPGLENLMNPSPIYDDTNSKGFSRLKNKVAIITGGDSGIGRAVSIAYAKEGAKVAIIYLNEDTDANTTKSIIEGYGGECLLIKGDIGDEEFCKKAISDVTSKFKTINILVNNAAEQHYTETLEEITKEQLERTFKTNIFGAFFITKAALSYLKKGDCIINTSSITAYKGNEYLIDYSCTKGAISTFTRSLALNLSSKGIRVNSVAPGPIWTPLIPSSFPQDKVASFGSNTSMGRAGQPVELAEAYVFLATNASSYISGETIHINGGEILNV